MFKLNILTESGSIVARKKDGSRAVLWDDNTITWLSPAKISDMEKHGMMEAV